MLQRAGRDAASVSVDSSRKVHVSLDPADHGQDIPASDRPIVILTGSRSGSTLLRFMLDAHPHIACPPEAGLGSACAAIARVWSILDAEAAAAAESGKEPKLDASAAADMNRALNGYYAKYLDRHGKQRWCDKSLDNSHYAKLIAEVFPDAYFICLYRHCMDMVASGIESSPWGLAGFGFAEFARQYPNNSVAAVAAYWLDSTRRIMAFESEFPHRCIRVRYEDLATAPEDEAKRLFEFLDADPVPGISEWCLAAEHDRTGPGDQKIWFTDKITGASLGRGVHVPASALPPQALAAINETLDQLGYRTVGADWNTPAAMLDPRAGCEAPAGEDPDSAAFRDAVLALIAEQLEATSGSFSSDRWPDIAGHHIHIAVEGGGCPPAELRWVFGQASGPHGDADAGAAPQGTADCARITAAAAVWRSVLAGELNWAVEILAGRIRSVSSVTPGAAISREAFALSEALGLTAKAPLPGSAATGS